jgi:hypothetical protein
MPMVRDNVHCFDNIAMFQGAANTEFGGHFLLILLLALSTPLWSELLHGKNISSILGTGLDEPYGATGTTAQHTSPFAILF